MSPFHHRAILSAELKSYRRKKALALGLFLIVMIAHLGFFADHLANLLVMQKLARICPIIYRLTEPGQLSRFHD